LIGREYTPYRLALKRQCICRRFSRMLSPRNNRKASPTGSGVRSRMNERGKFATTALLISVWKIGSKSIKHPILQTRRIAARARKHLILETKKLLVFETRFVVLEISI